jgi:Gas vesicle synthesis protein GvpL/GvpF
MSAATTITLRPTRAPTRAPGPATALGPAVPARLCILFSMARAAMTAGEGPVDASLGHMAGGSEWTIELFCDERRLAATLQETAIQIHHAASPSLWSMLAKQEQQRAARRTARRMNQLPDEILDAIEPHVLEVVEKPVLGRRCDERGARVSRLSVLVPHGSEDAFRAALLSLGERFAREGATITLHAPAAPCGSSSGSPDPDVRRTTALDGASCGSCHETA